jgi:hypothetical protein
MGLGPKREFEFRTAGEITVLVNRDLDREDHIATHISSSSCPNIVLSVTFHAEAGQ